LYFKSQTEKQLLTRKLPLEVAPTTLATNRCLAWPGC